MLNTLILQGRLTKDFIDKNGNAYGCLAVDTYKGETMFIDIIAFKNTADYCLNFLRKGASVIVSGSLNVNKYQDKIFVSCAVREIINLGNSKVDRQAKEEPKKQETFDDTTPIDTTEDIDTMDDDMLPF